jgi:MFS family permease
MIAVALPALARDLEVDRGPASVLVTTYLAAMLVCQPFAGRLGDRVGTRRVLAVAIGGFALASVAAGLAPSFPALLAARVVQAIFGAALIPNAQALLRATVPAIRRGRASGFVGTGIGAGAALGPVLGGLVTEAIGWRGIFVVNVPLGALALALLARTVAPAAPTPAPTTGTAPASPSPPARLGLLRPGPFLAACLTQTTSNFALYTVLLVLPTLLVDQGWTGASIGLATSGLTAGVLILGPVGGTLGDRRGRVQPIVAGLATVIAGAGLLALDPRSVGLLVAGPLVMGFGLGLAGASLQAAAMDAVPQAVAGSAGGLYSASRYVGSIAGSLAIGATGATGASSSRPVLVAVVVAAALATGFGSRSVAEAVD